MPKIRFEFENAFFEVGIEAYYQNLPIRLPDGRVLEAVGSWLETFPPQPAKDIKLLECAEATAVEG